MKLPRGRSAKPCTAAVKLRSSGLAERRSPATVMAGHSSSSNRARVTSTQRYLVGIAGPPGAGKSTLAERVAADLNSIEPGSTVVVPFDGFHLSNTVLAALGRGGRKGAPDSFDLAGFRALLEGLAGDHDEVVYAAAYTRDLEEAIAGAVPVSRNATTILRPATSIMSTRSRRRSSD